MKPIAAVMAVVWAGLTVVTGSAAGAAEVDRLRLASQTAWVAPGGEFVLRLNASAAAAPDDVELAVAVHPVVANRTAFAQTLDDRVRGTPITVTTSLLSELSPDEGGAVVVRLPVDDLDRATPADRTRIQLGSEGVYPVRAELRKAGGGPALASITTHLVLAGEPAEGGPELRVAWVLPVHAPVSLRPDTIRRLPASESAGLATLVRAVDGAGAVPVTLRPTPETLAALASSERDDDRSTVEGLARLARTHQVLAETFVPVSFDALVAANATREAARQVERGGEVLRAVLGVRPDPRTRVIDEVPGPEALDVLREQQVDRYVLPEQALTDAGLPVTLAQPFDLDAGDGRRPLALAADPALATHFDVAADPVLRAHQFLADLAMLHFERPGRPRGAVVVTPRQWRPTAPFLDAALAGLRTAPILEPRTLDDVFGQVPQATAGRQPMVRQLVEREGPARTLPASLLRATRSRTEAFAAVLDPDNPLGADLSDAVLAGQSLDMNAATRRGHLDGVVAQIAGQLARLRMPEGRTITLTARRGEIPITVLSELGYGVRARLRVESDQLRFPGGQVIDVDLRRRNTTELIAVRAQSSGAFPLRVRLESPDGRLVLSSTRLTVRSTSASWVGVALSVGAALFLVVWWGRHLARGRRNRRLVPA